MSLFYALQDYSEKTEHNYKENGTKTEKVKETRNLEYSKLLQDTLFQCCVGGV